jgi:hypothetical protein
MAGTIEVVERFRMNVENPIEYIELLWTSDADGDAEGEIDLRGEFANVSFQPGEDDVQREREPADFSGEILLEFFEVEVAVIFTTDFESRFIICR